MADETTPDDVWVPARGHQPTQPGQFQSNQWYDLIKCYKIIISNNFIGLVFLEISDNMSESQDPAGQLLAVLSGLAPGNVRCWLGQLLFAESAVLL